MPRDEEFEYLPTQAVSEYLASCVEPHLDGIIFHSAQTAGEGRNVVLFNHAAGVEPYALPKGTKVEINMGWASEEDYDDSITVWETVPVEKPVEKKRKAKNGPPNFADILEAATWEPPHEADENDQFYGDPTLKLDIGNIKIFHIKGVSYHKSRRSVSRHRWTKDEKSHF